jgi:hypothetical protein
MALSAAALAQDPLTIRGTQHSAAAIEGTVERAHAAVRAGYVAAFCVMVPGGEALGVAAEVDPSAPGYSAGSVLSSLRRAIVGAHGLRPRWIALLPPRALPGGATQRPHRREVRRGLLAGEIPVLVEDGGALAEAPQRPVIPAGRDALRLPVVIVG